MPNLILIILLLLSCTSSAQCLSSTGPPPTSSGFSSGVKDGNGNDSKWQVAIDNISGPYSPAVVMTSLPAVFYNSSLWISFSNQGSHTGDRFIFFKTVFELPCFNDCNQSFSEPFTFCLNLTLYADNSIHEIYVNGIPQSLDLPEFVRPEDPFNPGPQYNQSTSVPVTLCKNWKPGANTLIIKIASSATIAGINIEGNDHQEQEPILRKEICKGSDFLGYTHPGRYLQHYTGVNGCDSTRVIELSVRESIPPDFGEVRGICDGDSLTLYPGKYDTYLWNDGSRNEFLRIYRPGIYSVTVQDVCTSASTQILIAKGKCGVFFPNAFTANNDGKNDVFKIITDLTVTEFSLIIFNRWGQKVFDSKTPSSGWDGTLKGKAQPPDAYVWKCTFRRDGKVNHLKGSVLLIR